MKKFTILLLILGNINYLGDKIDCAVIDIGPSFIGYGFCLDNLSREFTFVGADYDAL